MSMNGTGMNGIHMVDNPADQRYAIDDVPDDEFLMQESFSDRFVVGVKRMFGVHELANQHRESGPRVVRINDPVFNHEQKHVSNFVSTGKYTFVTFLPKFLYEQFSRYANLFFLFVSCLQQIPGISPTGRFTTIIPLCIVLLITAVKEIAEDRRRHRADKAVNQESVKVMREGTFQTLSWEKVVVGDIVKVTNLRNFPADLVLLGTSEKSGECYVETSNLDGETNLKSKQSLTETHGIQSTSELRYLRGQVRSEHPNNRLYQYEGVYENTQGKTCPIGPENLVLRGSQLRNTAWIYGLVVFTGHETKLLMNSSRTPIKRSNLDHITNKQIVYMFFTLIAMSLFAAIGSAIWASTTGDDAFYLQLDTGVGEFFLRFLTFLILFNNLVPISLIVTLEMIKYVQAVFIELDMEIFDYKTMTKAEARTSNLNEELGQVQYVLSDKTGTLTRNIMKFKRCSIAGIIYGEPIGNGYAAPVESMDPDEMDSSSVVPHALGDVSDEDLAFDDHHLLDNLTRGHPTAGIIREFLTHMAVCHTVIPEVDPHDETRIAYQAASPDEGALVEGAKHLGFSFNTRLPDRVRINALGRDEEYHVLDIIEFNSTRKRMSVIVRDPNGRIRLYCKGADNVILERLAPKQRYVDQTVKHLDEFARDGLRTLCLAVAQLSEEQYKTWAAKYHEAKGALEGRERKVTEVAELIERDLYLLGATAIEDKLQEGVPETIAQLLEANMKVWMLTGDKQETAINIGFSCRLLNSDMTIMIMEGDDAMAVNHWLQEKLEKLAEFRGKENDGLALVVPGGVLHHALRDDIAESFLALSRMCKAVIACRVSPLQKAQIVKLLRDSAKAITLAIGDGANDVSMIQAAHVGVGLSGKEGLQAARSADYSIAQFRFLKKLLLVHGAWSYHRLSKVILYAFYKNIALYFIPLYFSFLNGFSGQPLFEKWLQSIYNVTFTFLPPLAMGIFDKFLGEDVLMRVPQLYWEGQRNSQFNSRLFWSWVITAMAHGLVIFFFAGIFTLTDVVNSDGKTMDLWWFGLFVYTCVLWTVLLVACQLIDTWVVYTWVAMITSIVLWYIAVPIYAQFYPTLPLGEEVVGLPSRLYSSGVFWFGTFLIPVMTLGPGAFIRVYNILFNPSPRQIILEMETLKRDPLLVQGSMARGFSAIIQQLPIVSDLVSRGFAFSAGEAGEGDRAQNYDSTKEKPSGE
eukprot:Clim_evm43s33 gene=Clim_evmTU43s33